MLLQLKSWDEAARHWGGGLFAHCRVVFAARVGVNGYPPTMLRATHPSGSANTRRRLTLVQDIGASPFALPQRSMSPGPGPVSGRLAANLPQCFRERSATSAMPGRRLWGSRKRAVNADKTIAAPSLGPVLQDRYVANAWESQPTARNHASSTWVPDALAGRHCVAMRHCEGGYGEQAAPQKRSCASWRPQSHALVATRVALPPPSDPRHSSERFGLLATRCADRTSRRIWRPQSSFKRPFR